MYVCMYDLCMYVYELIKVSLNRLNLQDNEAKSNLSPCYTLLTQYNLNANLRPCM